MDVHDDGDEPWEEGGSSRAKKTKLKDAHPGADYQVLRAVLSEHGREAFNQIVALWDLPSLYQVAAHDLVIGQATAGNDMAKFRCDRRAESHDPRVERWAVIERNVIAWLVARFSDKGRAEGVNYRHVAVCAYVASLDGKGEDEGHWSVTWPGVDQVKFDGQVNTDGIIVRYYDGTRDHRRIGPLRDFFAMRLRLLIQFDSEVFGSLVARAGLLDKPIDVISRTRGAKDAGHNALAIVLYQLFHPDPALFWIGAEGQEWLEQAYLPFQQSGRATLKPKIIVGRYYPYRRPIAAQTGE